MKKLKLTSLTAAALATAALATANLTSQTAKADTTDNQSTKAQTPKEIAQTNVDSAKKNVEDAQTSVTQAQNDLNSAQAQATTAENNYNQQSEAVSKAQDDVNTKASTASEAQSKADSAASLASEAKDPKKVKEANDAVSNAEKKLDKANSEKSNADQAVADKNKEITAKSEAVTTAQQAVASASAAKSDADKAVSEAQKALDGTGINEVQAQINSHNSKIEQLKKDIELNNNELEQNESNLKKDKLTVEKENDKLSTAQKEENKAQTDLEAANTDLKNAKTKLDKDKQIANSAAGFFKSLAENPNLSEDQRNDALMAYNVVMNEGKSAPGYEITFSEDKLNSPVKKQALDNQITVHYPKIKIKTDTSSFESTQEKHNALIRGIKLPWYTVDTELGIENDSTSLLNMKNALSDLDDWASIRSKYNVPQPKVSLTATAIAMMSSDYLNSHDFDHPALHPENGPFYMTEEDIAFGAPQVELYMDEKEYIDELIAQHPEYAPYRYDTGHLTEEQWKNNNAFWANHGLVLSGGGDKVIGHYVSMIEPEKHSIGMARSGENSSTDIMPEISYPAAIKLVNNDKNSKYEDVKQVYPYDSFTIDEYKKLVNSYDPTTASFINLDEQDVESKQNIQKNKQNNLDNTTQRVDDLTRNIKNLNNKIIATNTKISATNETLTNLSKELKTENINLKNANENYNKLAVAHKDLTEKLDQAETKQAEAQKNLNVTKTVKQGADDALEAAKKELTTLQANVKSAADKVETAQQAVTDAKNHVNDLNNADSIKSDADSRLTNAKTTLAAAQTKLKAEKSKLPALEKAKQEADDAVATAQANLDAANTELKNAQNKLTDAQNKFENLSKASQILDTVDSKTSTKNKAKNTNSPSKTKKITSVKLSHNAFIYDKNGKVVKGKLNIKFIKRGKTIKPLNAKVITIKGKKYYQVGKNQFIKASNAKIPTLPIKITATLKGRKNLKAVDLNGKNNGKTIKAGKKYHFNEKRTINGKTYYKITWTNNWVPASKLSIKK